MNETAILIVFSVAIVVALAIFITYVWQRESAEATFFDDNPLESFWLNPVFEGMSREFDLIGCKRVKNGLGIGVTYIEQGGREIGEFTMSSTSSDMNVRLRGGETYRVVYPSGKNSRQLLLKLPDTTTVATYTRTGGKPPGRVVFDDGSEYFYTPREVTWMSICPVKYWRDAAGAVVAVVFKPTSLDISLLRVIALRKGIKPRQRAAVLAFYLV